jgi:ATP-dependent Clp protease adapter protein ClpS
MIKEPGAIKILEVGGIPLFAHWSLIAGAALLSLFVRFDATATIVLCMAYVFLIGLHESAHAIAARWLGLKVFSISISGVGGLCRFQAPKSFGAALLVVSAGLLAQALLFTGTLLWLAIFGEPTSRQGAYWAASFTYLNGGLLLLNLIPEKPQRSHFGTDGHLLWKLVLNRRRGVPFAMPDTSATFSPKTRLAELPGFAPAGFATGIEILNDNTTPMEFVVKALTTHLQVTRDEAVALMLDAHANGGLLVAMPSYERAVTVANAIASDALAHGHPLVCRPVGTQPYLGSQTIRSN